MDMSALLMIIQPTYIVCSTFMSELLQTCVNSSTNKEFTHVCSTRTFLIYEYEYRYSSSEGVKAKICD